MIISKNSLFRKGLIGALILLGGSFLTGCLNDFDAPQLPPAAYVSIFQGSPDAPALDIFANSNRVTSTPLQYSEVLAYSAFYPGERNFRIAPFNSATSLVEKQFKLAADSVYSMFVVNQAPAIDALIVKDVWTEPATNKIQLRVVNLSPDAGPINVSVGGTAGNLFTGLSFKGVSEFKELQSGNMTFTVLDQSGGAPLLTSGSLELKGRRVYTLIVRGLKSVNSGDKKLDLQLITNYIYF
ncbi:DUF4397 domain-containing protein [Algoriphagus sp. AK58]|uniref:DUF4397 domain-containing protein n=1 Tax=Algoriphagus sp. AK58 TaxID=1406877 RepID=UPI001650BCDB|nr:DUF4397 domain-containing protein [Algoriphagus sp. AK58]MBC6367548.1 hypothetical protein [Algoriphagus sp. AK58]